MAIAAWGNILGARETFPISSLVAATSFAAAAGRPCVACKYWPFVRGDTYTYVYCFLFDFTTPPLPSASGFKEDFGITFEINVMRMCAKNPIVRDKYEDSLKN